jgi:hypothetical protein
MGHSQQDENQYRPFIWVEQSIEIEMSNDVMDDFLYGLAPKTAKQYKARLKAFLDFSEFEGGLWELGNFYNR